MIHQSRRGVQDGLDEPVTDQNVEDFPDETRGLTRALHQTDLGP